MRVKEIMRIHLDENMYTVINVPKVPSLLKNNDIRELGKLKTIGNEIIELHTKIPKFTSRNLEQILKEFNPSLYQEIMSKQSFLTADNRFHCQNTNKFRPKF